MKGKTKQEEESGANNKPTETNIQNERACACVCVNSCKPYLLSLKPTICLEKASDTKKHEKCFLYSLSSLPRGHSSAGADTGPGWTVEAEEGEQMCRFRWDRHAAGKCATFV